MRIGEVARRSGVSARMLRHYESLGLVRPSGRTGGGYREYSDEDIRRIFHVESLRSLGLSLRDVGRALDDPSFEPSALVGDLVRRTAERVAAETELLTLLRRIAASGPTGWDDVLRGVALLRALGSGSAGTRQSAALSSADEASVPVEALAQALLDEADPHVAGALRWALAHGGGDAAAALARGLGSPDAEVRGRAVRAVVEIPGAEATALLRAALADPDRTVRGRAALALGARGAAEAVPVLVELVVEGVLDVDAADALSALAADPALAERVAAALVGRLAEDTAGPSVRRRLTQALADVPGPTASRALARLSGDGDRAVALTAAYVLRLRKTR
ncbi:MerR family transcriptional regulator [Streptomyces sp. SHP 1-2]|uniref:MerR family transcriptional regulator n=1 Tax=Streptomyces sp. SHP 1-2 TaxID=2769489 RepID=UPI00223720D4|nr:MerR family transcriptional regulator [Streptomyces sp. SHP 1-2]MCW5253728.1 MerR family transcriptional regulator [Streptomyces sp. SHP 1-2]